MSTCSSSLSVPIAASTSACFLPFVYWDCSYQYFPIRHGVNACSPLGDALPAGKGSRSVPSLYQPFSHPPNPRPYETIRLMSSTTNVYLITSNGCPWHLHCSAG